MRPFALRQKDRSTQRPVWQDLRALQTRVNGSPGCGVSGRARCSLCKSRLDEVQQVVYQHLYVWPRTRIFASVASVPVSSVMFAKHLETLTSRGLPMWPALGFSPISFASLSATDLSAHRSLAQCEKTRILKSRIEHGEVQENFRVTSRSPHTLQRNTEAIRESPSSVEAIVPG